MRKLLVISILSLLMGEGMAQQLPLFTQYQMNDYIINPAVAGSRPYFEAKSTHRNQWIGITDAPRTFFFSLHGPLNNEKMGVGGFLFNDVTGPTRRAGFRGSYSYHLNLTSTIKASMALSAGILQVSIDGAKIIAKEVSDFAISSNLQSVIVPDFGFGTYIYDEDWYFHVSLPQLLNNKLQFFEDFENTLNRNVNHFYAGGGYTLRVSDFDITPNVLLKYVAPVPMQLEVGAMFTYKEQVSLNATYRVGDAVTAGLSYLLKETLWVGYSYDVTLSNLKNYSSGSHEVGVAIRFRDLTSGGSSGSTTSTVSE